jgi:3'-phosphoadenosine 5'-phosphosulfate sulfotransferase (PAPS reductase)/FAD synthetase
MNLTAYDIILVNSSAGKDSQAMLDYVVDLATGYGIRSRIVVVHADLGRVEWKGTRDLAEEQAKHYGVRFEVVQRQQRDLLEEVEQRKRWPDNKNRYCTSYYKRDQVGKVITKLVNDLSHLGRPVRVLNCMGIRSEESSARKKKTPFTSDARNTNKKRIVDLWFPIFSWTIEEVWARIKASGVRHHWAYDAGMKRLSCCFCVFAPKSALMIAGQHNPELLDAYVAVEQKIGHTFTHKMSIASVRDALRAGEPILLGDQADWTL